VSDDEDAVRRAIIESYKIVCICNKIRKGVIEKAIRGGARSFADVQRRTRAGTGDCKAERCGPVIRDLLTQKR
jgi:NAD(P)H-nitrite reductase large subunit